MIVYEKKIIMIALIIPPTSGGVKNAPKGSVTARLKGGCSKHILLAAANKRLLYLSKIIDDISFLIVRR